MADTGGNLVGGLADSPRAIEAAIEYGQNAPLTNEAVVTAGSTAVDVTQATARQARENPATFAAETALSFGAGAVAGRGLGAAGRASRRASTRVGGTKIDPTDLTNERTIRYAEGDITDADAQFPGAVDADLYETDPAASVRQQADEFTPEEIEERFDEAGVDDGTDLKKAVDRNPEGPALGRGNTGLETREGTYESPGGFAGPELSPNFLRLGGGRAGFSMRPGLPDFGSNPTGVIVRTDVKNPDADTLDEFNQELLDAEGETTARTKPADEVNTGEAEAVIPPEARFAPVRGGVGSQLRSRLGIGSDFYTVIDGQPVRLQPAAAPDLVSSDSRRSFFTEDRGQVPGGGRRGGSSVSSPIVGDTRRVSDLRTRGDPGTDRPLPVLPVDSPAPSEASASSEEDSSSSSYSPAESATTNDVIAESAIVEDENPGSSSRVSEQETGGSGVGSDSSSRRTGGQSRDRETLAADVEDAGESLTGEMETSRGQGGSARDNTPPSSQLQPTSSGVGVGPRYSMQTGAPSIDLQRGIQMGGGLLTALEATSTTPTGSGDGSRPPLRQDTEETSDEGVWRFDKGYNRPDEQL